MVRDKDTPIWIGNLIYMGKKFIQGFCQLNVSLSSNGTVWKEKKRNIWKRPSIYKNLSPDVTSPHIQKKSLFNGFCWLLIQTFSKEKMFHLRLTLKKMSSINQSDPGTLVLSWAQNDP